jgi:hypothetical protein
MQLYVYKDNPTLNPDPLHDWGPLNVFNAAVAH